MIRVLTVVMALYLGGWLGAATLPALSAQTLTDLHAVRGDVFNAKLDGVPVRFELAGVWVPTPPGTPDIVDYRGQEALEMVTEFLKSEKVVVQAVSKRDAEGRILAHVQVGSEDPRNLAVLLADAGYALWAPEALVDEEIAQQVRAAEQDARRGRRGIHDGGFLPFTWTRATQRDLGIELWRPDWLQNRYGGTSLSRVALVNRQNSARGGVRSSEEARPASRGSWDHIRKSDAWAEDAGLPADSVSHRGH